MLHDGLEVPELGFKARSVELQFIDILHTSRNTTVRAIKHDQGTPTGPPEEPRNTQSSAMSLPVRDLGIASFTPHCRGKAAPR